MELKVNFVLVYLVIGPASIRIHPDQVCDDICRIEHLQWFIHSFIYSHSQLFAWMSACQDNKPCEDAVNSVVIYTVDNEVMFDSRLMNNNNWTGVGIITGWANVDERAKEITHLLLPAANTEIIHANSKINWIEVLKKIHFTENVWIKTSLPYTVPLRSSKTGAFLYLSDT